MGHHLSDDEVDQPDLRANLNKRDLWPTVNNRHRERDEAERERWCKYDEEYDPLNANHGKRGWRGNDDQQRPPRPPSPAPAVPHGDISGDLDGFSAFSNRLRGISWPATFKPVGINKFDGDSDPKTWIRTYSMAV
ncbi:putative gag-pol precursor [Panicum miliaceum]|uniref:Gag-pol n=1 Tax=Panicum miliaceum TaxID=4540 RepID=A0A3L6QGL3_PANMI|nr:putative gag-pol precursor [Panicum miliaceum]